jgi:Gly-Xaa carboxypeptidase
LKQGAYYLNEFLEAKYGKDSMWLLVDEGNGITEQYGQVREGLGGAD